MMIMINNDNDNDNYNDNNNDNDNDNNNDNDNDNDNNIHDDAKEEEFAEDLLDEFSGDEEDDDGEIGKRTRKLKRGKGIRNISSKRKKEDNDEDYYVDVGSMKATRERKEYLRKVFKKESHVSCIENILRKRRKSGDVPDLSDLSSLSTTGKRKKKFGQSLSVHEIRELNRKAKPSLQESFARNAS